MKNEKKKHTKASLNLYIVAGLYLLYLDYSILSKWNEIEGNKPIVVLVAIIFAAFAISIMIYSVKGLIKMNKK